MRRADNLTIFTCRVFFKPRSLNLLEFSGPIQACTGIALPFYTQSYASNGRNRQYTDTSNCQADDESTNVSASIGNKAQRTLKRPIRFHDSDTGFSR